MFQFISVLLLYSFIGRAQAQVSLRSSGPTVRGANVTLTATIPDYQPDEEMRFEFVNFGGRENAVYYTSEKEVNYTVELSKEKYKAGFYSFQVRVYSPYKDRGITQYQSYGANRVMVPVSDLLHGNLKLTQNGRDKSDGLITPYEPVNHSIDLSESELQFVKHGPPYFVTWYLNCSVIRTTTDLSLVHTYENLYNDNNLEVIVAVENGDSPDTSSARTVSRQEENEFIRRPNNGPEDDILRLSNFKCAPIDHSRYTYGYYNIILRADTSSSPAPAVTLPDLSTRPQRTEKPRPWISRSRHMSGWNTTHRYPSHTPHRYPTFHNSLNTTAGDRPDSWIVRHEPFQGWNTTHGYPSHGSHGYPSNGYPSHGSHGYPSHRYPSHGYPSHGYPSHGSHRYPSHGYPSHEYPSHGSHRYPTFNNSLNTTAGGSHGGPWIPREYPGPGPTWHTPRPGSWLPREYPRRPPTWPGSWLPREYPRHPPTYPTSRPWCPPQDPNVRYQPIGSWGTVVSNVESPTLNTPNVGATNNLTGLINPDHLKAFMTILFNGSYHIKFTQIEDN